MKQYLLSLFALLVASCMVLTSCEKIDSLVVGTWKLTKGEVDYSMIFNSDGTVYSAAYDYTNGRNKVEHELIITSGTFTIEKDIIYAHYEKQEISIDGGPIQSRKMDPYDEQIKFRVDENNLRLTRNYGSNNSRDEIWTRHRDEL